MTLSLPKTQTRPEVYELGGDASADRRRRKVRRPMMAGWQGAWPGNVRELRGVILRSVAGATRDVPSAHEISFGPMGAV